MTDEKKNMTEILLFTFIYMAFAVAAVLLSQKLGLGSVLGYLAAGILIGPVLGFVGKEAQSIQHVAEFGVVMMLFLVGLELAPKMLWQMRVRLFGLGGLQVLMTLAAIAAVAFFGFGLNLKIAVAIGCILSLSSTAIVLQTFNEKNLLSSEGGRAGFAVLLFQDVAAIPMLALLPLLGVAAAKAEEGHVPANVMADQPGWMVASVSVAAIFVIIFGVRILVPAMFRFISKSRLREMFTLFTLALVVGIATLMSLIGLSPALGAFIAGVALANSSYRHEMESNLEPFKGLLLGLFFITVGAGMNFNLLGREFGLILGITAAMMLLKAAVLLVLGRLFRLPGTADKLFALSLSQAGEFGFVLLSISEQSRVLPAVLSDRISLVVAMSMLLTPLLFIFYEKVIATRGIAEENDARPYDEIHEENPIILLGHGRFGRKINSMLLACGYHTTVIDSHAETVEGLTKYGSKTYFGDATNPELLNAIGLAKAKLLVVGIADDEQATEIVGYVRRHYPDLTIIARAHDRMHAYALHHAGADFIVRETFDASIRSGRIALEALGVSPDLSRELSEFYAARDRYHLFRLSEDYDPEIPIFANEKLMEKARELDRETAGMLQTIMRGGMVDWQLEAESWTHAKKN